MAARSPRRHASTSASSSLAGVSAVTGKLMGFDKAMLTPSSTGPPSCRLPTYRMIWLRWPASVITATLRPVQILVLCCFFLTGASGLVFEQVWTRELELVFGSTTLAISTVLSVFMGGLGLG